MENRSNFDNVVSKEKIIIFNGVSSSGKSTLARALQDKLDDIYYIFSLDDFILMVGEKKLVKNPIERIKDAYINFHQTIRLFADMGRNVIVDTVYLDDKHGFNAMSNCLETLKGYDVLYIKVVCSLEELERREKERGNREIGQARSQLQHIFKRNIYDLEIDTTDRHTDKYIQQIMDIIGDINKWKAFNKLSKNHDNSSNRVDDIFFDL